jgi:hypothetical protein
VFFQNLKNYQDKHKGETCYIFGDGPSIKSFDYKNFTNHVGICCGMQAFHKDFDILNVKYYCLIEPYLFYPDWMLFRDKLQYIKKHRIVTNEFRKIIKEKKEIDFFINLSNIFAIRGSNVKFIHRTLATKLKNLSHIYDNNIDPFSGSFFTCLSLAYHMGFKKVFLVGHDGWTLRNQVSMRWYEHGYKISKELSITSNNPFINFIKKNMEIYSIVYEKETVNFDSILYKSFTNKSPVYKENDQLINSKYLNLLKRRFENA